MLTHSFVSLKPDGSDASKVRASKWNDDHVFAGGNNGSILLRDTSVATYGASWLPSAAPGQVLVSAGAGALPAWSAAPTISGTLTLGTQSSTGALIRLSHVNDPFDSGTATAYFGISTTTTQWTNDGTYEDHLGFYGWNPDIASNTEPNFGLSLESKFSQGGSGQFGIEMHLLANFRDGAGQRAFTTFIDRASPHLILTALKGQVDFVESSTAGSGTVHLRMGETGDVTFYGGPSWRILNYANGASSTGHTEVQLISSDTFPELRWNVAGVARSNIVARISEGAIDLGVNQLAGGTTYVRVNGGNLVVAAGTVTAARPTLDLSQTWNNGAIQMAGIQLVITDTASAVASRVLDMRVAGVAIFTMRKDGLSTWAEAANLAFGTTTGTKIGTATTQKIGFFNATPVVQPTRGATLTNSVTAGGTNDTIANYTDLSVYANDAAAIRNNIYQLARALNQHDVALRALGLLS
jgi:hypothetical protein